jgi:hypothetical protein
MLWRRKKNFGEKNPTLLGTLKGIETPIISIV